MNGRPSITFENTFLDNPVNPSDVFASEKQSVLCNRDAVNKTRHILLYKKFHVSN